MQRSPFIFKPVLLLVLFVGATLLSSPGAQAVAPSSPSPVTSAPTAFVSPVLPLAATPAAPALSSPLAPPPIAAAAPLVPLPRLTITVPGATIHYFSVQGATSAQLGASVLARSGTDCGTVTYTWFVGDGRESACAKWHFLYWYYPDATACTVTNVTLVQDVYFPQWTSSARVSAPLLAWWRQWMAVVSKHEAGHIAINKQWLATFRARLIGKPCAQAKTAFAKIMKQVNTAQEAYDKSQYAILVFPPPPDD